MYNAADMPILTPCPRDADAHGRTDWNTGTIAILATPTDSHAQGQTLLVDSRPSTPFSALEPGPGSAGLASLPTRTDVLTDVNHQTHIQSALDRLSPGHSENVGATPELLLVCTTQSL